jgi:hypothetical protein
MTHPLPIAATLRILLLDARRWIPAFAGMTHPLPIAATLRILLLDGCVT